MIAHSGLHASLFPCFDCLLGIPACTISSSRSAKSCIVSPTNPAPESFYLTGHRARFLKSPLRVVRGRSLRIPYAVVSTTIARRCRDCERVKGVQIGASTDVSNGWVHVCMWGEGFQVMLAGVASICLRGDSNFQHGQSRTWCGQMNKERYQRAPPSTPCNNAVFVIFRPMMQYAK